MVLLTSSAIGSPRDLRVFEETTTSMKVSWEPAPGTVLQYHMVYQQSAGGPRKEMSVKGDETAAVLNDLQPGTEYSIFVSASYHSGLGDALEGRGTTLEGRTATSCISAARWLKTSRQIHSQQT